MKPQLFLMKDVRVVPRWRLVRVNWNSLSTYQGMTFRRQVSKTISCTLARSMVLEQVEVKIEANKRVSIVRDIEVKSTEPGSTRIDRYLRSRR